MHQNNDEDIVSRLTVTVTPDFRGPVLAPNAWPWIGGLNVQGNVMHPQAERALEEGDIMNFTVQC